MKKIITNIIIISVLLFVSIEILFEYENIMNTVKFSINIWKNNIFPSLFPFFVISELLINYGFVELVGELLSPIMHRLFKTSNASAFVFVMSIISGIPSNAKYVAYLIEKNIITDAEGTKILMFTHFSNPIFILGTVSLVFLNNKEVGLLILLAHYGVNIIIGILFRNYYPTNEENTSISLKRAMQKIHKKRIENNSKFGTVVSNSLVNSINTLLMILGIITFFLILTTIIDQNINLNSYYQSLLNGTFEITQGLKYISMEDIPLKLKATICVMLLSFGGLSGHMQVVGILSNTRIKYLPYLTARLLHAFLSSIIIYFLFDIWFSV